MLIRIVLVLLIFTCLLLQVSEGSHGMRKSFHCYRPFDSLSTFSLAAMKAKDNCWLDYMRVLDAGVMINCYTDGKVYASGTSGDEAEHGMFGDRFGEWRDPTVTSDRNGCYATMFVKAVREEGTNNRGYVTNDEARFAVKLHTKGGGEVHYKGMDGIGYSACCMLLNQPQHSSCAWRNVTHEEGAPNDGQSEEHQARMEQYVEYCHLEEQPEDLRQEGDDPLGIMGGQSGNENASPKKSAFIGTVTKPLHRQMAGIWTMEVLFFRGHTSVGKVVSDFNVTYEMAGPTDDAQRDSVEWTRPNAKRESSNSAEAAIVPLPNDEAVGEEVKKGEGHRHHRNRKHHKDGRRQHHHRHGKHDSDPAAASGGEEDLVVE